MNTYIEVYEHDIALMAEDHKQRPSLFDQQNPDIDITVDERHLREATALELADAMVHLASISLGIANQVKEMDMNQYAQRVYQAIGFLTSANFCYDYMFPMVSGTYRFKLNPDATIVAEKVEL